MLELISPSWPVPEHIKSVVTTRHGGVSCVPYCTFNLAGHVGDDAAHVQENRRRLHQVTGVDTCWLNQVHGTDVIVLDKHIDTESTPTADAAMAVTPNVVCAIQTADCLPVLLCDKAGTRVAAIHAGWRSLAGGIIEKTVLKLGGKPSDILAYLGPAISKAAFEVGEEVVEQFALAAERRCWRRDWSEAVHAHPSEEKAYLDIYSLAKSALNSVGVEGIYGGDFCTFNDAQRFYSYRRDGRCGRMASLIWIDKEAEYLG